LIRIGSEWRRKSRRWRHGDRCSFENNTPADFDINRHIAIGIDADYASGKIARKAPGRKGRKCNEHRKRRSPSADSTRPRIHTTLDRTEDAGASCGGDAAMETGG